MDKKEKKLLMGMVDDPKKVIAWAKKEIKEYEKIIIMYELILKRKNK